MSEENNYPAEWMICLFCHRAYKYWEYVKADTKAKEGGNFNYSHCECSEGKKMKKCGNDGSVNTMIHVTSFLGG